MTPRMFEQVIMKLNAIITLVLSDGLNHSLATLAWMLIMNGLPIPPRNDPNITVKNRPVMSVHALNAAPPNVRAQPNLRL